MLKNSRFLLRVITLNEDIDTTGNFTSTRAQGAVYHLVSNFLASPLLMFSCWWPQRSFPHFKINRTSSLIWNLAPAAVLRFPLHPDGYEANMPFRLSLPPRYFPAPSSPSHRQPFNEDNNRMESQYGMGEILSSFAAFLISLEEPVKYSKRKVYLVGMRGLEFPLGRGRLPSHAFYCLQLREKPKRWKIIFTVPYGERCERKQQ